MDDRVTRKYKSAMHYVLHSLIPYTEANIKLSFTPKQFFYDLSKLEKYKTQSLKNSYYECIKRGFIELDGLTGRPFVTQTGKNQLLPYKSNKLKDSLIMIIFDIPEGERYKRNQLRILLRELRFSQVQKSVWVSEYDSREYISNEVRRLRIENYVEIFESRKLSIK